MATAKDDKPTVLGFFSSLPGILKAALVLVILFGVFYIGYMFIYPLFGVLSRVLGTGVGVLDKGLDQFESLQRTRTSALDKGGNLLGSGASATEDVTGIPTKQFADSMSDLTSGFSF